MNHLNHVSNKNICACLRNIIFVTQPRGTFSRVYTCRKTRHSGEAPEARGTNTNLNSALCADVHCQALTLESFFCFKES